MKNDRARVPGAPEEATLRVELVPADADFELLEEFVIEALELLRACENSLLALDGDPDDTEAINTVFRGFHSIKGTAACLSLELVSELSHSAETLLSRVRDGEIRCTGPVASLALRTVDVLEKMMKAIRCVAGGGSADCPPDVHALMGLLEDPGLAEPEDNPLESRSPMDQAKEDAPPATQTPFDSTERAAEAVRIRTDRLDQLIEMVGELVIAQSIVHQDVAAFHRGDGQFDKKVSHASKIVRGLQDLSFSLRLVPLEGMFRRLARVARDAAERTGKRMIFEKIGEATEIDRNMVDLLIDPLVHMVRNAVDHGIEPAEERQRAGKPAEGRVRLAASREGSFILLTLEDDGRGLDRSGILAKAVSLGLIRSDTILNDDEIDGLILKPGFSTADEVSEVSGRGVGLDVVNRNIETLHGRMAFTSTPGAGTTFTLRLPLTLAMTEGLLIRVGRQRFILPTACVQSSFRPSRDSVYTYQDRGEMIRIREQVLPLMRLSELLDIPDGESDVSRGLVTVVRDADTEYALLIDELVGQQRVVVKSVRRELGRIPGISGAAILADGNVGLILDPGELVDFRSNSVPTPAIPAHTIDDGPDLSLGSDRSTP